MKNILAICGSLRAKSTNLSIIENVAAMSAESLNISLYQDLSALPAFNPDLDTEDSVPPAAVADLRKRINESDGVLICTPEYVFAVPGALKNAIDWTVSSAAFVNKPTALITASGLGEKAHESLLLTLQTLEAKIGEKAALHIPYARTKINAEGIVSDAATVEALKNLIESFIETVDGK
jgi:NAD(P)H-dependent FMN reductase